MKILLNLINDMKDIFLKYNFNYIPGIHHFYQNICLKMWRLFCLLTERFTIFYQKSKILFNDLNR